MPVAPKTTWLFWWYLSNESYFQKVFDGNMLIKIQPKTLLQIFNEFIINFKVILKSIESPDDTCQWDLQAWMGWIVSVMDGGESLARMY